MLKKRTIHPPILFWHHTPTSTPELSPTSSSSDVESDEDMDHPDPRPLSLSVSPGAFCPMRPTLDEVLADTAPAPFTLSAFMAYLSQNHCLETLEFTLEANRYREAYGSLGHQLNQYPIVTDCPDTQQLRLRWQRLLTVFILPGGLREINVSSDVRDDIVRQSKLSPAPPPPHVLDAAVRVVRELMEESIFLPFLNSQSSAHVPLSEPLFPADDPVMVVSSTDFDEHTKRTRSKARRSSPPSSKEMGAQHSSSAPSNRQNFSLSTVTSLAKPSHWASGHVQSVSGDSGSATLTDDSGSLQSNVSMGEPMTPPTTPPSSEPNLFLAHSPKSRTENPWKKMGMKLGFKKRSGGSGSMRLSGMEE
ncbi:hypothetical protein FE257_011954 [Aspergillus nanangensis]|uniref:RGS domain-containing protein n=1 Tax=Aspergillus nanangensis TaxID=2582783 RepID=A0AAD4CGT2_ASPNN|nr:hypothetical protein FE257_011954 [Aspergillus nanangensis]